ncbi:hypothetical protein KM176_00340 [Pseudooceanicola sp. CBS1P-1]|uniref:hypothetical protein n=1 Tax=Pseudooceanicola TaxID=1679449 RepID=UPI001926E668|nr:MULTISPECIES: hypothetical protein [Pseudooceanicola]MBT9382294.1 hypothetical protein [Pseudooceanicola endophyticus]
MAEKSGNSALAFVLGAVVVVVAGLAWYVFSGGEMPGADKPEIQIDLPDGS